MNRPQMMGMAFAFAAAVLGVIGLMQSRPLPQPAGLGEFAVLDTSNDGHISESEWTAAGRPAAVFRVLDANRDGALEPAETEPRSGAGRRN